MSQIERHASKSNAPVLRNVTRFLLTRPSALFVLTLLVGLLTGCEGGGGGGGY